MELAHERLIELLDYDGSSGQFRWKIRRGTKAAGALAGFIDKRGYVSIGIDGRLYYAHQLAVFYINGEFPALHIDHINRIKSDNRISNLRQATRAQNNANTFRLGRQLPKGVRSAKAGKFAAFITVNKKYIHLGVFRSPADAHEAYKRAALSAHGEFACFS